MIKEAVVGNGNGREVVSLPLGQTIHRDTKAGVLMILWCRVTHGPLISKARAGAKGQHAAAQPGPLPPRPVLSRPPHGWILLKNVFSVLNAVWDDFLHRCTG